MYSSAHGFDCHAVTDWCHFDVSALKEITEQKKVKHLQCSRILCPYGSSSDVKSQETLENYFPGACRDMIYF